MAITFGIFLSRGYRTCGRGCGWRVHTGRGTEIFYDLRIRAWRASSTLLQQLGYKRSSITLNQGVLFSLDGLHQRSDQWVKLVRKPLQVNYCTSCEHVDTQMQLLPFCAGLHHCCLSLLSFTVQCLPLFRLNIQTCCWLCEDGGYLRNKWEEKVSDLNGSNLLQSTISINLRSQVLTGYRIFNNKAVSSASKDLHRKQIGWTICCRNSS